MSNQLHDARGRFIKGTPPPPTAYKPGTSGNIEGLKHQARMNRLIQQYGLEEVIVQMGAGKGRFKRVKAETILAASTTALERAFGKPAAIALQVNNQVVIQKRIIGVDLSQL